MRDRSGRPIQTTCGMALTIWRKRSSDSRRAWLALNSSAVRSSTRCSRVSFSVRRASSACLRSVMSRVMPVKVRRLPTRASLTARSSGKIEPSLRRPWTSRPMPMILRWPVWR